MVMILTLVVSIILCGIFLLLRTIMLFSVFVAIIVIITRTILVTIG